MKPSRTGDAPAVRIEAENECAWRGEQRLQLMPRAFAVLRHLVDHPGRLITKEELLTRVWRDTIVSEAALTTCIRDLRKALGDSSDTPRYIETVHRRGFRFIGPIAGPTRPRSLGPPPTRVSSRALLACDRDAGRAGTPSSRGFTSCWRGRWIGQRQLVFVTGEPGIGKTALVEAFLSGIGRMETPAHRSRTVRGAVRRRRSLSAGARGAGAPGPRARAATSSFRSSSSMRRPGSRSCRRCLTDEDLEAVQRRAQGATRERMLRELVEALDILTVDAPLVLVLEDLHWSDSATVDLLAMLARRREAVSHADHRDVPVRRRGRRRASVEGESSTSWSCTDDVRRSRSSS